MTGPWLDGDYLTPASMNARAGGGLATTRTYNTAWPRFAGATTVATIQNTINAAATDGILAVMVAPHHLPYDAALVTFNNTVHMMREGGDLSLNKYDLKAYGAVGDNATDDYNSIAEIGRAHV